MGAAAVAADVGSVCVPLALGSAIGKACGSTQERCQHRICIMDGPPACIKGHATNISCVGMDREATFKVFVTVHTADVVEGIIGTFTDNEPVIAVRALTLPYTQVIGRKTCRHQHEDESHAAIVGRRAALGDAPAFHTYTFGDFQFTLPGMSMYDEVVIAFGTRTVVRLPLAWGGVSNAPLDFDVLGTVSLPLRLLIDAPQPVEVLVPIQWLGESLQHVARSRITFQVATSDLQSELPVPARLTQNYWNEEERWNAELFRCDEDVVEQEIEALELQLEKLKVRKDAERKKRPVHFVVNRAG